MAESNTKSNVIPIKQIDAGAAAKTEDLHASLVRDGWMRQTTIGEPRLSELVKTYEKLGYEVRVEAYQESREDCSAATSDCASAGSCGSGGCSASAAPAGMAAADLDIDTAPEIESYMGMLYIRKSKAS